MRHTFYAEVPDQADLDEAMNELKTLQRNARRSDLRVHHGQASSEEAELEETGARKGALIGALAGGVGGFLVALFATAVTGALATSWLLLLLTLVGGLFGTAYCAISGSGSTDPALDRLIANATRHAHYIVTVISPDEAAHSSAELVLRRHGAIIHSR